MRTSTYMVLALTLLATTLIACAQAVAATDFRSQAEPVQRVYDLAGVLSADDKARLERRAQIISEQAGVPTVIYVQRDPTAIAATSDEPRNVATVMDADEGLVVIVSVRSSSPRFGQVSFFVGRELDRSGRLTLERLNEIYQDEMVRHLRAGRLVDAVNLGLSQVAYTLIFEIFPAPPRSPREQTIADLTRLPLNALSFLAFAAVVSLWARVWRSRPRPGRPDSPDHAPHPLSDIPPAVAGAIASGRLTDALPAATMLDLARRGAIAIEPAARKQVQVRLLRDGALRSPHETALWDTLASVANDNGVVCNNDLQRLLGSWRPYKHALRLELEAQGWFDPTAEARRRPLRFAAGGALFVAMVMLVFSVAGREAWGFLGVSLMLVAGAGSLVFSRRYRATTATGEELWSVYQKHLPEFLARGTHNDAAGEWADALPYAVALGKAPAVSHLSPHGQPSPDPTDRFDASPLAAFLITMEGGRAA